MDYKPDTEVKDNEVGRTYFGFGRNVYFAGIVSFFMDISSEMVYPLVPLFLANVLGVNKSVIGLMEGVAESTASILRVFSGWLWDHVSPAATFYYGAGTAVLSSLLFVVFILITRKPKAEEAA